METTNLWFGRRAERASIKRTQSAASPTLTPITDDDTANAGPKGYVAGTKLNDATFEGQPRSKWWQFAIDDDKVMAEMEALHAQYEESRKLLEQR